MALTDLLGSHLKGHSLRVSRLARRMGEQMGFPDLDGLEQGGLFHDVGKLVLPRGLLEKPGRLSEREERIMRLHPLLGYGLLVQRGIGHTALNAVLFHHERDDGSGYPFGLLRREIPLEARIVAVADTWVALRENRPYRKGLSFQAAWSVMLAEADRGRLDPELLQLLRASLGRR